MPTYDYDLFTIGAGSAGVRASRMAAGFGAHAAVAEERYLGGTCVNVGCIPKKLLVYAAHFSADFEDAAGFGWSVDARQFDWARLIENKNEEIRRLNSVYDRVLQGSGVTIINGRAQILDAHTVAIAGKTYTAEHILIATGGWPTLLPIPGVEYAITSNEAFFLPRLPDSVLIVGGGYIGVEFAGIFHGLGSRVTLVHRGPVFLTGFDDDIRAFLAQEMSKKGIQMHFNAQVASIEQNPATRRVTLKDGTRVDASLVMFATGRAPNTKNLGLENAGVKLNADGAVVVDDYSRTSTPNIYAVGDCTDRRMLTPVALAEGKAVAETLFNNRPTKPNYTNVPTAIFSNPNVGTVGLTEAEARRQYGAVDVYKTVFRPLKHTLSGSSEQTMMKLVVDRDTDRVLGCHMVGADAGEIIQGLAVALNCGATKAQFDATIGIHPTAAEEFVTMREKVA